MAIQPVQLCAKCFLVHAVSCAWHALHTFGRCTSNTHFGAQERKPVGVTPFEKVPQGEIGATGIPKGIAPCPKLSNYSQSYLTKTFPFTIMRVCKCYFISHLLYILMFTIIKHINSVWKIKIKNHLNIIKNF